MSFEQSGAKNNELRFEPEYVAERQLTLGNEWADLFAEKGNVDLAKSAELTLRNPIVYLQDVSPSQLNEELKQEWSELLAFSESLVSATQVGSAEWSHQTSGLEKLQQLMYAGKINPDYKGAISDVIRKSSKLFSESSKLVPGDTAYYAGNVQGMAGWIQKRQESFFSF